MLTGFGLNVHSMTIVGMGLGIWRGGARVVLAVDITNVATLYCLLTDSCV